MPSYNESSILSAATDLHTTYLTDYSLIDHDYRNHGHADHDYTDSDDELYHEQIKQKEQQMTEVFQRAVTEANPQRTTKRFSKKAVRLVKSKRRSRFVSRLFSFSTIPYRFPGCPSDDEIGLNDSDEVEEIELLQQQATQGLYHKAWWIQLEKAVNYNFRLPRTNPIVLWRSCKKYKGCPVQAEVTIREKA